MFSHLILNFILIKFELYSYSKYLFNVPTINPKKLINFEPYSYCKYIFPMFSTFHSKKVSYKFLSVCQSETNV